MFEELIPFSIIALILCAAFVWVFLILLTISTILKKDILEESKPYKMFFCAGLITIIALLINSNEYFLQNLIVGFLPILENFVYTIITPLNLAVIQLIITYIILLKFQFRKKEAAICTIIISILTNYYIIVFISQLYTIIIDGILFPNIQSRYIETISNMGAMNPQDDSYRALESLIIIAPVFVAILVLFIKLAINQVKNWDLINSKKFKGKLYLFAGIFIILMLIFVFIGINAYNEQKQYYEETIAADNKAEQNAPTAFELVSETLTKAITQGYYEIKRTRIKGGSYEVTSQALANKLKINPESIIFTAHKSTEDTFQTNGTNLVGSKEKNFIIITISCKETVELAVSEILQKSYFYNINPSYTNACNDLNYCCLIAVK